MLLLKKAESPMEGNCQVNDEVYWYDVTRPLPKKVYLRLAERVEETFHNRKLSFKYKRYSIKTRLSSYMWHLKKVSNEARNMIFSVWRYILPYSNISKKCLLRLYKKLEIITYNESKLLNKRSELLCNCRHVKKYLLKNLNCNEFR